MRSTSITAFVAVALVAYCLSPTHSIHAQGFPAAKAVEKMKVAEGLEVALVACEPLVRQPVCVEFDNRGRLWVIQYLQYPNPAGLKRVKVDRYSRTTYDRVPEPPPSGPRGADRITILEDTNGDGRLDRGKDFVSGLNLATGIALGHGGVFVLNVPYLLFYPDKNRDDVPDGDPKVLLSGFGMEDAHSVANSLTWGPDGWLYGCQGSTVTANIRGIEFQQGIWRFHPTTQAFELFCEGGGNAWGLDFDPFGNLFYSTNYGGHVLVHGVQGGYFIKSFGKHGALHNPHAYGYLDHAAHANFRGGHVTVGGMVYQADLLPHLRGKYVAADLLGHAIYSHDIQRRGSTVQTAHDAELLLANDTWFAPTDVTIGPEGAIYVADWHDPRMAHPDPDAEWDRSNGRIYRIAAKGSHPNKPRDLAKLTINEILKLHQHPSQWYVRRARQELAYRRDPAAIDPLREHALTAREELRALEALWSLHAMGGFDPSLAMKLLESPHAHVRSWTVRLLGDEPKRSVTAEVAQCLDQLAEREPSVAVRQQLASTCARLPAQQALPIINTYILRDIDNDDPYMPLLWWWAVERHSLSGREEVLRRFERPSVWRSRLGRETQLPRLVRRYAAEGNRAGLDALLRLTAAAPDDAARTSLWRSIAQGWREVPRAQAGDWRKLAAAHKLAALIRSHRRAMREDLSLLELGILLGDRAAANDAVQDALNPAVDVARRIELLELLAGSADDSLVEPLLKLVAGDSAESLRSAALKALSHVDDPDVAKSLIALHQEPISAALKSQIREVLLARKTSAYAWLTAVDRGDIDPADMPLEQVRGIALLDDPQLNALVARHWGQLQAKPREEQLAEVRRLNNDLRAGTGNAAEGKTLFTKHCATCHELFGDGTKLGPSLTTANRADRDFLLVSLVDPSSVIRKEYVSVVVETTDGRVLTGLPVSRAGAGVTLRSARNEELTIAARDIEELRESLVSLMPDDLYRQFRPQDLRDLFAYLQSQGP